MLSQTPTTFAVQALDVSKPVRFPAPFKTIAFLCDPEDGVLTIYAEAEVHPADWDQALAYMSRIAARRPQYAHDASYLASVSCWQIQRVESSAEYLD